MKYALIPLLFLSLSAHSEDLTHLIDTYRMKGSINFTNTSQIPLQCQISSRIDPTLPLGTVAERRNITLDRYMSYTHYRSPDETIIYCERLIQEHDHAAHTRLSD